MGAFVARQPNGLLCRFSDILDCPTHYNMTDEEYVEMCAERAREEARDVIKNDLRPFELVKERFIPNNITNEKFDRLYKIMHNENIK